MTESDNPLLATGHKLQIRTATGENATEVADLYLDSRKKLLPFASLVHSDEEVCYWIRELLIPGGRVRVALLEQRIAGLCATSSEGSVSWIEQLYLRPEYLRMGIGSALLRDALAGLRRPVQLHSFQQNERARLFYRRHGFKAVEFRDGSENEEGVADILYRLT